jgi:hypothetical protein
VEMLGLPGLPKAPARFVPRSIVQHRARCTWHHQRACAPPPPRELIASRNACARSCAILLMCRAALEALPLDSEGAGFTTGYAVLQQLRPSAPSR